MISLDDELVKKNVHIAVISESVGKQKYAKGTNQYIQIHCGVYMKLVPHARVMILINKSLK